MQGLFEGLQAPTSIPLIVHLSASLVFLSLVSFSFRKPFLVVGGCFILQIAVWSGFLFYNEASVGWLSLKVLAVVILLMAFKAALEAEKHLKVSRKTVDSQ